MSLTWTKQALSGNLAKLVRAATRRHPQIDGHTFGFNDLKEMWCAEDVHMVCTHGHDPIWQYWYQAPEGGWRPVSMHETRELAKAAAEHNTVVTEPDEQVGVYVLARLEGGRRWMRVKVLSSNGEAMLTTIFKGLGCTTKTEHIEAA